MRAAFCVATAVLGFAASALADPPDGPLHIGDRAPEIDVREFFKGDPVRSYGAGKIYVVSFWGTWCKRSLELIPSITELQRTHQDVTFIGVSVREDQHYYTVKGYVEYLGAKMAYRVAIDRPLGTGGRVFPSMLRLPMPGAMETRWLFGTISPDVPSAFIIDGSGKIAWIGDPSQMAKPLQQIMAGKWDLRVAARNFDKEQRDRALIDAANDKLRTAESLRPTEDLRRLAKMMDKTIDDGARSLGPLSSLEDSKKLAEEVKDRWHTPMRGSKMGVFAIALLLADQNTQDRAYEKAREAVRTTWKDDSGELNLFAWYIVAPGAEWKPQKRFLELALEAARRADALTEGKYADSADTLARAYFVNRDPAKALAAEERALQLAKSTVLEHFKPYREHLETYRKAVAATKK